MELTVTPSQRDIEQLKSALEEKQRQAEYDKLKKDLMQISLEANHQLTEFDGGLKQVDTHKILKDQDRKRHFADFIIQGFVKMMSPRPVARNLLAIGLIFAAVFCVVQLLNIKQINPYKIYFCYFLELAAAIQILKSSARSLFIPVFATLIGAVTANVMPQGGIFLAHHQLFYQVLLITGVIGITISVFTID